jgi:hypothetical protein
MKKELISVARKRRIGDRNDGRKIRSLSPMTRIAIFIMKDRNDALNYISDTVDTAQVDKYILKKRSEGLKGFGLMHVLIAAYVRIVSQLPGLNRFISGQTLYARNELVVALNVKKSMDLNAQDTVVKQVFPLDSTAEQVFTLFSMLVEANRGEEQSDFDNLAKILNYIPRLVLRFFVGLLKFLDYFGLLPKALTDLSPFHASYFITSMGSLGIPPIYHHLYNFGNVPVFFSFGARRSEIKLEKDGSHRQHWLLDYKFVLDERICDGHYYATALKMLRDIMRHPDVLDKPPEKVVEDVE